MDTTLLRPVTEAEIDQFWREGVVRLRGVIDPAWLESLVEPIEGLLKQTSPEVTGTPHATVDITGMAEALRRDGAKEQLLEDAMAADQQRGRYLLVSWSDDPAIRRFETSSMVPEIAAQVLRSKSVDLLTEQILVKEPGAPTRTAFHTDEPYFNIEGDKACSAWVPLDTVTLDSGAMGYIRGSHRWTQNFLPNFFVSQATTAPEGTFGRVKLPDIEGHPEDFDLVYYETEPGDVVLHHYRTVHGSGGNTTANRRRRAITVRYCGDDIRWQPSGLASRTLPAFQNSLQPGEPLSNAADHFPRCWSAPTD